MIVARSTTALALQRCLRVAFAPTLAVALLSLLLSRLLAAEELEPTPGAMTPWLHLPMFTAAITCACATAMFWPLFAARRPGADWIVRTQRGPLGGCGAAIAGTLCAQALLTLPLTTLLPRALGAPARAESLVVLHAREDLLLDTASPRLRFAAHGLNAAEIRLRPLAAPPRGPLVQSRVQVLLDGDPVQAEASFDETRQLARLRFPPRPVGEVELVLESGSVPLLFAPGSVVLVAAEDRSNTWNGVIAAGLWLAPTFVALALACLCGCGASIATVLTVIGCVLFVQTLGGAGGADDALRALLRGHWLPAQQRFSEWLPFLAAGSAAMILAMILRRRRRR